MTAKQLFQSGKLNEAIQALSAELRSDPTDVQRRTFLFELLCFAGEYDRADKQLDILTEGGNPRQMGAILYKACLHAERTRSELFAKRDFPTGAPQPARPGTLNGKAFQEIEDVDPRLGARLEVIAAGAYLWIPLAHVISIEMSAPKRLRDLLWTPATVRTGPAFRHLELGEVMIPALCPFSSKHADEAVRLGRLTVWEEQDGEVIPYGQKMLLVDGEDFPLLELRKLEFAEAEESEEAATAGGAPVIQ